MRTRRSYRNQHGAALIIGLLLVAVASLGAITSMRGTLLQDRMVSNQQNKIISQMAAEAGAARFVDWLTSDERDIDLPADWNDPDIRDRQQLPDALTGDPQFEPFGYFTIDEPSDWGADPLVVVVNGFARSSSGEDLARSLIQLTMHSSVTGDVDGPGNPKQFHSAFYKGMLADGDIRINGSSQVWGSVHTNSSFNMNGSATMADGKLSAVGTVDISFVDFSSDPINNPYRVEEGAEPIEMPSVADSLGDLKASAGQMLTPTGKGAKKSCDISLTGDQGGTVFYCTGNAEVSGSFGNATIVAEGDITHKGAAQLGGEAKSSEALTVAFIAAGDLIFDGSSTSHGIFWSDGDYLHNGSGVVQGSIVAGGSIRRNGSFVFRSNDQIDATGLPSGGASDEDEDEVERSFSVMSWIEVFPDASQ